MQRFIIFRDIIDCLKGCEIMLQVIEKTIVFLCEAFFLIGAGLGILGLRISIKKMLLISCIHAALIYLVRWIYVKNGVPFGSHTIILFTFLAMELRFIGNQRMLDSTIAVLMALGLLILGEGVILIPIVKLFELSPEFLLGQPGMTIVAGLLSYVPLIIVFVLSYFFRITVINLNQFREVERM